MATPTTSPAPRTLVGSRARRRRETAIGRFFLACALVSVAITAFIIYTVLAQAIEFLLAIDLSQLVAPGWFPRRGMFDVATLIIGTLIVTLIAMLIAAPVGVLSAIYLSEYATPRVRGIVKPVLEVLAGIPSVVLGFFALTFINPAIIQSLVPGAKGFNLASAAIAVGILTIPLIASIAEDAMRAVPHALREASYGLGARRVTTATRVVLPAAVSGIVAAIILGVSRAVGETMVVAIAAGASGGSLRSWNPFESGQTMTAAMAALATGSDQVAGNNAAFQSLFFVGLVLFVFTLLLNVVGDSFVRRVRQAY
ncbi:MAG: phosphate ABC transporter permease subunit PstC [Chloroflexi bacterium RBG_16_72_14]|nr:MAG: phosphate ABC transporter permease subunit PstC [Chloroflexi bacterium RBG_16_72_14]